MSNPFRQIDPDAELLDLIADLNAQFADAFADIAEDVSPQPIQEQIAISALLRGDEDAAISKLLNIIDRNFEALFEAADLTPPSRVARGPLHRMSLDAAVKNIKRVTDECFDVLSSSQGGGGGGGELTIGGAVLTLGSKVMTLGA